ncbi:signal peptidase II [Salinibacter ruber]|uniref:signal peptidase II n=1 Tax=Salinibacter ruber TaxID=146919 RepID=UPI002169690A|nr:signal peptidase II [Salinibacter ruber]MCS3664921.1 signal peptidase II [Salinibacter ruber]
MRVFWIAGAVVLLDQATKATVLQFMYREQSIPLLGDWLRLTFTENPGMAFGITIGPPGTVTVLSLLATMLVGAYIYQVRNDYAPYRWSLAFILGGALGNIIDRVFYGVLLDYGPYFTGRVVDFIHVSLWQGFIPRVIPVFGGAYMELFPIWNVADMSIVVGVVGVMVFHQAFHERRIAKRRAARAGGRTWRRPAAVFSDLDLEAPPPAPSALTQPDAPASRGEATSGSGAASASARSSAVSEPHP